jgi:peptidoglycan/xylan/chitin deacetylase (PgdA/CDA1 family)
MKKQGKRLALYLLGLTLAFFFSCTSAPAPLPISEAPAPAPVEEPEPAPVEAPPEPEPSAPEPAPPEEAEEVPVPQSPLEEALALVKADRPNSGVIKTVRLDEAARELAAIEGLVFAGGINFKIEYFLLDAVVKDGVYTVPFRLSGSDGTTAEDSLQWVPGEEDLPWPPGILLSLDDDFYDSWTEYAVLAEKYNARISFFMLGPLNFQFWKDLESLGHEAAYHTLNHIDLRNVSEARLKTEAVDALEELAAQGLYPVSLGYPYGFYTEESNNFLLKHYKLVRGYGARFRIYTSDEIKQGFVISKAIDNTIYPDDSDYYRAMEMMLRSAAFLGEGAILPFTTHVIGDAAYGISPERLDYLLRRIQELGLKFYLYRDFF